MVQALIQLTENTNRVLNIIKAQYDLRDKGEAIEFIVSEFIQKENKKELRPEFIKEMKAKKKEKALSVGSIEDFKKRYRTQNV